MDERSSTRRALTLPGVGTRFCEGSDDPESGKMPHSINELLAPLRVLALKCSYLDGLYILTGTVKTIYSYL
jgi:hypothetical protein